jgi:L-lactate dehydrogenase complex protein LldG
LQARNSVHGSRQQSPLAALALPADNGREGGAKVFETFKARAEAVSAEVHCVATKADAIQLIVERMKTEGVADTPDSYAVWADCPFLKGVDKDLLVSKVPGLKFNVSRELAADSKVGVSQMDWAIADTGTLAQNATAVEQRLVSTLPFMHIALLASDRLVPNLASFLAKQSPRECNYLALITGASRTADIERVLTIGVHGPEKLVIILVDELEGLP